MHTDFAEWHKSAGMKPDAEALPKHWTAIEAYDPQVEDIVSLTRLFYRLGKPDETFLASFRASFQTADTLFPMRDNDQQLAVLAGAELVHVIDKRSQDLADMAALSLVCAAAQNLRSGPPVLEIPEIAARYLEKRTTTRSLPDDDASKSWDKLQELERELAIVGEESNMLWWLVSEHSRDLKKPWSKYPLAVSIVAGKELADLTRLIPGPIAAAALLDKVVNSGKKTKSPSSVLIRDVVNEAPIEWRENFVRDRWVEELADIVPISTTIKLSLIAPQDDAWLPAFENGTGIARDSKVAPAVLAYQMFLEGLLSRSFGKRGLDQ
jgi:GTPase-associated system helical domain